jgi:hypothetical protein
MRSFLFACLFICFVPGAHSQVRPVAWTYWAKKSTANMYELHLKVIVDAPWHIYSQFTPDGGPNPTVVTFNKSPLVTLQGKTKESGKLKQKHEEVFKVDVKYYDGKVEFGQLVKVKGNIKTSISGTISYMICNDEMCLPPYTDKFNIQLK